MQNKMNNINYYRKGDIIKSAEKFRKDLIKENDAAMRQMANAYSESLKRLKPQFAEISRKIANAQESGKEFSINWLYRQERYKELISQCEAELNKFAKYAEGVTQDQQTTGKILGLDHSKKLALSDLPDNFMNWNAVPHEALKNLVGFLGDGSPLNTVFANLAPEVTRGIKDVLTAGLAQGWNPRKTARAIEREFGKGLIRTELVCRTEQNRAYRTASLESYKANADVVEGVIWISAHQRRTCAACWSMNGKFFKFDEIPSDHPAGRCTTVPKTKSWDEIAGYKTGIEDTSAQPFDSEKDFLKLKESDQKFILGKAKYEAWKDGDLKLRDIAGTGYSRAYGEQIRIKTLEELGIEYPAVKSDIIERAGKKLGKAEKSNIIKSMDKEPILNEKEIAKQLLENKKRIAYESTNETYTSTIDKEKYIIKATTGESSRAAYDIGKVMGLEDNIPKPLPANITKAMSEIEKPSDVVWYGEVWKGDYTPVSLVNAKIPEDMRAKGMLYDYVVGNPDRHGYNLLVDKSTKSKIMLIDHDSVLGKRFVERDLRDGYFYDAYNYPATITDKDLQNVIDNREIIVNIAKDNGLDGWRDVDDRIKVLSEIKEKWGKVTTTDLAYPQSALR